MSEASEHPKPSAASAHHRRASDRFTQPVRWFRNRSLPLLVGLLALLLCYPWFDQPGRQTPLVITVAFAAVPVFGVLTLGRFRWGVAGALTLMIGIFVTERMEHQDTEALLAGWVGLFVIAFYVVNISVIGRSVMKSDSLIDDRVYGGIAVYILIGVMFAVMHHRLGVRMPEAYRCESRLGELPLNWADYLYFSFSTFTTVGFGDIVPANAFSRSLAVIESIVGVLYPAVLIARLVNRESWVARP